jgi:hypothetical protein
MKENFAAFIETAEALTGLPVAEIERVADDGGLTALDAGVLDQIDTLIIISFDSFPHRPGSEWSGGRSRQGVPHAPRSSRVRMPPP